LIFAFYAILGSKNQFWGLPPPPEDPLNGPKRQNSKIGLHQAPRAVNMYIPSKLHQQTPKTERAQSKIGKK